MYLRNLNGNISIPALQKEVGWNQCGFWIYTTVSNLHRHTHMHKSFQLIHEFLLSSIQGNLLEAVSGNCLIVLPLQAEKLSLQELGSWLFLVLLPNDCDTFCAFCPEQSNLPLSNQTSVCSWQARDPVLSLLCYGWSFLLKDWKINVPLYGER